MWRRIQVPSPRKFVACMRALKRALSEHQLWLIPLERREQMNPQKRLVCIQDG